MSAYKNKHLQHLKQAALGTLLVATTLSGAGCQPKEKKHDNHDMLTTDSIISKDFYGHSVKLEKVSFALYDDENMTPTTKCQLFWGVKKNHSWTDRSDEATHAEKIYPSGDTLYSAYVEVYDDNVLKDNQSLVVYKNKVALLGDENTYRANLLKFRALLHEQQALERQKKNKTAKVRKPSDRGQSTKNNAENDTVDTIKVASSVNQDDSVQIKQNDEKNDSVAVYVYNSRMEKDR
jgi:hypothetical protein